MISLQDIGLSHSEISGSKVICTSPKLIAAYHVLHRLQKPRHPPFALVTFSLYDFSNHGPMFTHWSHFTRCLEIAVHNSTTDSLSLLLQTKLFLLTLPRYLFSNLSMNFSAFRLRKPLYVKKTFLLYKARALQSTAKLVSKRAPKRRCSSHTFRYGYLVTT